MRTRRGSHQDLHLANGVMGGKAGRLCCRSVSAVSNYCLTTISEQTEHFTRSKTPWSESASELYRPTDRRLSAKWLPNCADRGCHVVCVTDPSGRISRFSRQEPLLFYQVAPQFVLMRLSAPRSRPTTFFFGSAGNRTRASGSVAKNSDH
jgi:hypothetical protein